MEESEKAMQQSTELNPRHLWLEPPGLCHWAMTARQPPTLTILYMYCKGGTECLSNMPGSHSVLQRVIIATHFVKLREG